MTPIRMDNTNVILGAPENWDVATHGPCEGLPACHAGPYFYSYWQPDKAELKAIAEGKPIRLTVCATGHPPVYLSVEWK